MLIGYILKTMNSDVRTRKAPVFAFESTAKNPFQILVSTMLSARTKDSTSIPIVNKLFKKIKRPEDIIKTNRKSLECSLYGIGFYRTKTKYLFEMAKILIRDFNSQVPDSFEDLISLPGVGRKTANIVLARVFGKNTIGVDVHVHRISNRLGLVKTKTPEQTEKALLHIVPEKYCAQLNNIFVAYGQTICLPKEPNCTGCRLEQACLKRGLSLGSVI